MSRSTVGLTFASRWALPEGSGGVQPKSFSKPATGWALPPEYSMPALAVIEPCTSVSTEASTLPFADSVADRTGTTTTGIGPTENSIGDMVFLNRLCGPTLQDAAASAEAASSELAEI